VDRRVVVHLLWVQPQLVSEFERALGDSPFRVEGRRLESPDAEGVALPKGDLFAIDGARERRATEAVAGSVLSQNLGARILVVAESFTESSAFPLLRLGVKGILTHAEVPGRLREALQEMSEGGFWVPRAFLSRFVDSILASAAPRNVPSNAEGLTEREREVMETLLENSSNKEIASRLHISERTAKFHVSNVLSKYGVRRRADLILLTYSARKEA